MNVGNYEMIGKIDTSRDMVTIRLIEQRTLLRLKNVKMKICILLNNWLIN